MMTPSRTTIAATFAFLAASLAFTAGAQAALLWDFDTGDGVTPTLDGWTIISNGDPEIDNQPLIQVEGSERDRLKNAPVLTTAWDRDGKAGGFRGDNAHPPLIARSPTFYVTESASITWEDAGINHNSPPVLTDGTYDAGAHGLALVRASDGVMIASEAANNSNEIDVVALGLLNDGIGYYLEAVDTRSGGWGYVEWDEISVPGDLMLTSIEGDFNGDLKVDQTDLSLLLSNWGVNTGEPPAGWDEEAWDPAVDQDELSALLSNWGAGTGTAAAVPEPSTLLLVAFGLPALILCGRRRK